jgi:hypothetical protein
MALLPSLAHGFSVGFPRPAPAPIAESIFLNPLDLSLRDHPSRTYINRFEKTCFCSTMQRPVADT